jgi:ubiquinone/menaquinone biosynthesis C-methylase UbiE
MKTDTNKVSAVWDEFAQKYKLDRRASTPDAYLVDLEIRTLAKYIKNGESVIDIGAGNGYTALMMALKKEISIIGVDISSEMIASANKIHENYINKLKGTVKFEPGNILDKGFLQHFGENSFDTVLTKRTIINILSWEEQKTSIIKIWHLLKPGGKLIMMEATAQGYEHINRIRNRFGMSKTPIRWHNKYLDEKKLLPFLNQKFETVFIKDFSSTYYIGSRVVQPLLIKPFKKEPSYDFFLNRFFSYFPSFGNYGIQKIIVCHKKEL